MVESINQENGQIAVKQDLTVDLRAHGRWTAQHDDFHSITPIFALGGEFQDVEFDLTTAHEELCSPRPAQS